MQKYKLFLVVYVISILISIVFGYTYLYNNWEEIFGPRAKEFCDFNVVRVEKEESIDNKTCYRVDFMLNVKKDMYLVEISPRKRSDSITDIDPSSLDKGIPASRTLIAGTDIYPSMLVQLENTYGWVYMRILFKDVDYHEKEINETVDIGRPLLPPPKPPGFEAVFAIAGLIAVAYLLRRRK